jgi:hypothetical protein
MDKNKVHPSSGVGGVSVFTDVGAKPMGKARNETAKRRLATKLRNKTSKYKRVSPIGSVVQSPDQQDKTMTMGKQPIVVMPDQPRHRIARKPSGQ